MLLVDKYGMVAVKSLFDTVLAGMVASPASHPGTRVPSAPKTLLQVMAKASALNALKLARACVLAVMEPFTKVGARTRSYW
jgi:hypothetical protein